MNKKLNFNRMFTGNNSHTHFCSRSLKYLFISVILRRLPIYTGKTILFRLLSLDGLCYCDIIWQLLFSFHTEVSKLCSLHRLSCASIAIQLSRIKTLSKCRRNKTRGELKWNFYFDQWFIHNYFNGKLAIIQLPRPIRLRHSNLILKFGI